MEVSVRELKNKLSEYLRKAQAGEPIVVTSRGKVVGRLLGPETLPEPESAVVRRLRAQPWIQPGKGEKVLGSDKPIEWPPDERPLSELILEDRD